MSNIKNIIYEAAKTISSVNELDITAEELASLALYKVMNMPYFEGSNDFLTLHYNVFDELSIGNVDLNKVKGYTNGSIDSFVVIMDTTDQVSSKIEDTKKILKKNEKEILEKFINLINTSNNVQEVIAKITEIEKEDPLFLNKAMTITGDFSYSGNNIIRMVSQLTPYTAEESHQEYMLETKSKIEHYRNTRGFSSSTKDICFDSYNLKDLASKPFSEIVERIQDHDLELLTGLSDFSKEKLESFPVSYPNEYDKSLYKILKENESEEVRCILSFDLFKFEAAKRELNKTAKQLLSNPSDEDIMQQYDKPLQAILKTVAEIYPQVRQQLSETPYEIKTFIFNTADEKENFIEKECPLEIYQDEYMSLDYRTIKGNTFYRQFYRDQKGIYISAHNGLEDVLGSEGSLRKEVYAGGYRIPIENIRVSRIYEAGRDVSLQIKQDVIEAYVKMAADKKVSFVYDILERGQKINSKFNNDLRQAVENLQEKYPDVIFINDGIKFDNRESLKTDVQGDLLATLSEQDLPYHKLLIVNKKINEFFDSSEFEEVVKLDYFDRKKDTTIEKAKEIALKELTKNKIKVTP